MLARDQPRRCLYQQRSLTTATRPEAVVACRSARVLVVGDACPPDATATWVRAGARVLEDAALTAAVRRHRRRQDPRRDGFRAVRGITPCAPRVACHGCRRIEADRADVINLRPLRSSAASPGAGDPSLMPDGAGDADSRTGRGGARVRRIACWPHAIATRPRCDHVTLGPLVVDAVRARRCRGILVGRDRRRRAARTCCRSAQHELRSKTVKNRVHLTFYVRDVESAARSGCSGARRILRPQRHHARRCRGQRVLRVLDPRPLYR